MNISDVRKHLVEFFKTAKNNGYTRIGTVRQLGFTRSVNGYISVLFSVQPHKNLSRKLTYVLMTPKENSIIFEQVFKDCNSNHNFIVTYNSDIGRYISEWIKENIRPVIANKYKKKGKFLTDELVKSAYLQWWSDGFVMSEPWWEDI